MKIFHLPDLGEGLAEAEIREWYVKEGDEVKVDQPLVSMETAKAVVDVPSPYAGKIGELHGKVNDIIKTGAALISFITDEATQDKGSVVGKLETGSHNWDDSNVIIGSAKKSTQTIKAMPAARVLAQQFNLDLATIKPTGPNGLITANDVKQHHDHATTLTGATDALHGVRRAMALAMTQSHREIVPVTIFDAVNISHLPPKTDVTVSLLQAIVAAAKVEPALNALFDGKHLARQLSKEVNIGLAMDMEEGLFVPVIKQAEQCSATELRQMIDDYKKSVNARTIKPQDMHGATITLSNFGMIAGSYATPIVVPPMVAILGCGRIQEAPVSHQGKLASGRILPLSLTFDHRAVTGGEATRFLGAVIKYLQDCHPGI